MALRTFVKVSGINNLSDARYCAGMGVDQLGFNIEASHENYTDPKAFREISDWLSGVEFVGEIENETTDISSLVQAYSLQAVQVAHESQIETAVNSGLEVIFKCSSYTQATAVWNTAKDKLSYILIETDEHFESLSKVEFPLVLQSTVSESDIDRVLEILEPKGIALVGGNEIRPGYKDFDSLADILEVLEIDDLA